jgi:uncharacterized protein YjbI with pentapeptide repeats
MSPYDLAGIWYLDYALSVRRGNENHHLAPFGTNFALVEASMGNGKNPDSSYNVYSTPNPGEYIFQSQFNGMFLGMSAESGLVCASFSPAQAQPLIPTVYHWSDEGDATILYLPDRVHYLGWRDDGKGFVWRTDNGGPYSLFGRGALIPTSWSFSEFLAGKGTGGFTLRYAMLPHHKFPPGADLRHIDFSGAVLDDANLDKCDLTGAFLTNCSLKRASLNSAILVGAVFDGADLTGAQLFQPKWNDVKAVDTILDEAEFKNATLTSADMPGASMKNTAFVNSTINGGDFSNCDLTSVDAGSSKVVSTQSQPVLFNGAKLNFSLVGHNWEWMDLRNATVYGLPEPLSSSTTRLKATGAKLSGLNQDSLKGMKLEHAVLDYSLLDGLDLSGAHLTGASFIQASMHGTNLTGAILKGARMTGAQLGSLSQLFTLETSFEHDLNAGPVDAALRGQFSQHGITLSESATLTILASSRVWQLNDVGNKIYIRLETKSDNTQVLTVYAQTASASLVDAYMPDAVLTGANLYGVLASGAQFYGSNARLDGSAILEEVEFNDANLSNLNLTQANLLGANLSWAQLFNAKFNKANLGPSANGKPANLSHANLQGADFTDAQLDGASLANAATAINVPTSAVPNQGGVYLFSLPYATDTKTLQQYTAELNAAASKFSLNPGGDQAKLEQYVSALKANNLAPLKSAFLSHQPPIILSDNAQIQTVEVGDIWQIVDGAQSYTLWTDLDENGKTELYAVPSLTKTQAAFQQKGTTLRWQASAAIDKANQQWLLDNDSESQQIFTGYVKFIVKLNGSVLDVYGTAVRIERLVDNNQLQKQIDTEPCNPTAIAMTNMDSKTMCPNETALGVNQKTGGVQWDTKWLRAANLPSPPTCVPTDYSWCPQTQTTNRP